MFPDFNETKSACGKTDFYACKEDIGSGFQCQSDPKSSIYYLKGAVTRVSPNCSETESIVEFALIDFRNWFLDALTNNPEKYTQYPPVGNSIDELEGSLPLEFSESAPRGSSLEYPQAETAPRIPPFEYPAAQSAPNVAYEYPQSSQLTPNEAELGYPRRKGYFY